MKQTTPLALMLCCALITSVTPAVAGNTLFHEGDAFFPAVIDSTKLETLGDGPLSVDFLGDDTRLMLCGYQGINRMRIHHDENFIRFVRKMLEHPKSKTPDYVQQRYADYIAQMKKNSPGKAIEPLPEAFGVFLFYNKGYDPSKHGFFIRYNPLYEKVDYKGSGVHIGDSSQAVELNQKYQSEVMGLKVTQVVETTASTGRFHRSS